jgi:hypothetical protein
MKKTSLLQDLLPAHAIRIVVYLKPINVRWGPVKLRDFCAETLSIVPDASTVFLFSNKSQDSLLMYFTDNEGDQMLLKKLDKGAFLLPVPERDGEAFVIMKPSMLPRLFRS